VSSVVRRDEPHGSGRFKTQGVIEKPITHRGTSTLQQARPVNEMTEYPVDSPGFLPTRAGWQFLT
jgi:hypothetical protein